MKKRTPESQQNQPHTLPLFPDVEPTPVQMKLPEVRPPSPALHSPDFYRDPSADIDNCRLCDQWGPGNCPTHGRR